MLPIRPLKTQKLLVNVEDNIPKLKNSFENLQETKVEKELNTPIVIDQNNDKIALISEENTKEIESNKENNTNLDVLKNIQVIFLN